MTFQMNGIVMNAKKRLMGTQNLVKVIMLSFTKVTNLIFGIVGEIIVQSC